MSQPDPLWIASAVWVAFGLAGLMLRRGGVTRIAMGLVAMQGVVLVVSGNRSAGEGGQVLAVIGAIVGAALALLAIAIGSPRPAIAADADSPAAVSSEPAGGAGLIPTEGIPPRHE